MSTQDVLKAIKSCCACDCLKYSALPIVLMAAAACGLKCWLKAEAYLSLIFGAILMIYPQPLLALQMKGPIDNYHIFLCNLLGCYLIYSALFPIFLRKSKDDSIYVSHFWSRIISSNLILLSLVFSYLDGLRWSYHLLCYTGGAVLVTLLVNTYFLMKSSSIRAQNHMYLVANTVAKFEFFMLLSAGLLLYAFPKESMLDNKAINEGHLNLCRICGALLFALSIESFTMPSFLFEVDKKNFLQARLIGSILELVVIVLGICYLKVLQTYFAIGVYLFINMSYNLLIGIGYLSCVNKVRELKKQADKSFHSANSPSKDKSS